MTSDTGPRRLLLLRHAKAEHPDADRRTSSARCRSSGASSPAQVGAALAADDLVPDLVLCSSSVRTRQTWELVRGALGADPEVRFLDDLYYAGSSALVELVRAVPDDVRTVLVVGHEPTMSQAAVLLAGPDSDPTTARARAGRRADRELVAARGRTAGTRSTRAAAPAPARGPGLTSVQVGAAPRSASGVRRRGRCSR